MSAPEQVLADLLVMAFGDNERLQPLVDLEMLGAASGYRLASGAMML
jgi:hypothetical protein